MNQRNRWIIFLLSLLALFLGYGMALLYCVQPTVLFWLPQPEVAIALTLWLTTIIAFYTGVAAIVNERQTHAQLSEKLFVLNRLLTETNQHLQESEERFRASVENMLDCFGVYSAIRDENGTIIDFRVEYVNDAACRNNEMTRSEQIGRGLCEILPGHRDSGLFEEYCQVVETGQPLVKDSLIYEDNYGQRRLVKAFDIRVAKFEDGFIATWRDVTEQRQNQEELRLRKQEFEALAGNSPDVISRLNCELRHTYVNPAIENATGLKPEEFVGKTPAELGMSEELSGQWMSKVQAVLVTKEVQVDEFSLSDPDGNIHFYQARLAPEFAEDGSVTSVLVMTRDITEFRQNQEVLRQSQERLNLALEAANMGTWDWNIQTGEVYWSPNLEKLFGMVPGSFDGQYETVMAMIYPEDQEWVLQSIHRAVYGREDYNIEFRFIKPDGTIRWAVGRGQVFYDQMGNPVQMTGVDLDITERKQVEAALRESELMFRTLADTMPQMFWITQPDGYHEYFNQRWYEYTGTTLEQTQGEGWQNVLHPDDVQRTVEIWQECVRTGKVYDIEYRCRRAADGEYRWHLGQAFPLRNQQGQIVKWFGSCTDIHDRKLAIEERAQALERERAARIEIEQASRMKDEFLAIVSHELRSPLNAILGWSRLLQTRKLSPEKTEQALASIERNAQAQTQLIEDLLDISRIIRGKIRLNLRPTNLIPVIQAALDTVRPTAKTKSLHIESYLNPNVGLVSGDPDRLQQIVWNLLSNAVKFTPEGGRVEVQLERMNSYAQIRVIDTGKGINPDFLPYVFDRFRQADATTSRTQSGLGLGLAIVRNLVELHGGEVGVDSQGEGKGTTFFVKFPILQSSLVSNESEELSILRQTHWETSLNLSGLKILAVDDDADALEFLKVALEQYGAVVVTASSARKALQLLTALKPDVLLSDIGMPEQDGYTLIRQIRLLSPEQGGQIPAAALTAYARESDRIKALEAGFQMHIPKPIEPIQLLTIVARLVGR
ncbi:MAG: PAS domain S-box protein [Scytonema sp. PMC 1069.18]|nr:PAS domain S-box protein [Scytonema sp. PMC 1069.18]MEC4886360.1 PAS domain S-box protein [Scytonema sp. PMC 1070.18]